MRGALDAMRLVKDAHEIDADAPRRRDLAAARIAARWSARGPGWFEYQVEAELVHEFLRAGRAGRRLPVDRRRRARTPACCTTARTTASWRDGELLLIDAGCEYQGYASDITRTFPVNGRFTGPQRDVYELVLAAQLACLDAVKPGADFHDYHKAAERVLAQGYIDLGLCTGTLDEVLETGSYKQFYMHRAGHWLGLDVHDAGPLPGEGRVAEARAGHGAHGRARHLHPPGGQRARGLLEHRRAHRGRRAGHGRRRREPHGGHAEDGGRGRGRLRGADAGGPRCTTSSSSAPARWARTLALAIADARSRRRRARRARPRARRCAATARSRCRMARG